MGLSSVVAVYQIGGYLIVVFNGGVGKNGSTVAVSFVCFGVKR